MSVTSGEATCSPTLPSNTDAGRGFGDAQQLDLLRLGHRLRQHGNVVRRARLTGQRDLPYAAASTASRGRRGVGRLDQARLTEIGRVGEPGCVAANHADAGA